MKKIIYACLVFILAFTGCTNNNVQTITNNNKVAEDFIQETALFDAIRAKDTKLVDQLIDQNVSIDGSDKYGYTPLHLATRLNEYDVVEKLINKGASVNSVDKFGDTPLLDSTRNSTNAMSKLLICNGANKNVKDRHDMTPLHNASKNDDLFITMLLENDDTTKMCEKLDITLTSYDDKENKICGDIASGVATNVNITIAEQSDKEVEPFGPYTAKIEDDKYCATLDKPIKNGSKYLVTAVGNNGIEQDVEIANLADLKMKATVKKEVTEEQYIKGLYEALVEEFKDDFKPWNAELDKNGLVFRFKNPADLFDHGSSKLSKDFKKILKNFFPRYLKVLSQYKDEIAQARVEGHTSSVYKSAKNDKERYEKNLKLSTDRAKNVYNYTMNIKDPMIKENSKWLKDTYVPVGMSYDNLIYAENGVENQSASRRVEFRINKKLSN